MAPQLSPQLQGIASLWCSSFIAPACGSSSHDISDSMVATALLCSATVMAPWCSSSIALLCCGGHCEAIHPAQGSITPGPTCTVCLILSSWSAPHGPTPPLHPPGVPLHHGPTFQELKNTMGAYMYKNSTQICFICSALFPPFPLPWPARYY